MRLIESRRSNINRNAPTPQPLPPPMPCENSGGQHCHTLTCMLNYNLLIEKWDSAKFYLFLLGYVCDRYTFSKLGYRVELRVK